MHDEEVADGGIDQFRVDGKVERIFKFADYLVFVTSTGVDFVRVGSELSRYHAMLAEKFGVEPEK